MGPGRLTIPPMRIAFFVLLLANLLFLAWVEWVALPAAQGEPRPNVPRLQLVSRDALPPVPAAGAAHARAGALGAALAAQADAPAPAGRAGKTPLQCFSVGPFQRNRDAKEAAAILRAQDFAPQARTAAVKPAHWYWVYVPDVGGNARVQRTLNDLQRDGIDGAEPMPTVDGQPGISLGLFRDPALARRQLALARAKGFAAQVTGRLVAQPAYWLDLWSAGAAGALPMKAMRAKLGAEVGVQTCPRGDAPPLPSNATGMVAPGVPLPADEATTATPP